MPPEPSFALAFLLLLGNAAAAMYGIAMRPVAGGFMQQTIAIAAFLLRAH